MIFLVVVQIELSSMLDAVHETETKMVEMSALNHLMSTHVLQQAHQIEYLYEQVSCYLLTCKLASNHVVFCIMCFVFPTGS